MTTEPNTAAPGMGEPTSAMLDAGLPHLIATKSDVRPLGQFYPGMTADESEEANQQYHGRDTVSGSMESHEAAKTYIRDWCPDHVKDYIASLEAQPAPVVGGVGYGIIDPDYARIFTVARVLCWSEGYALTMHGSFTRDLDLVAVPWTDRAREPEHLARRILETCGLKDTAGNPGEKSHGRLVWTMRLPDFGDPRFVDFSVMPLSPPLSARPGGEDATPSMRIVIVDRGDGFTAIRHWDNIGELPAGEHFLYTHPAQAGGEDRT